MKIKVPKKVLGTFSKGPRAIIVDPFHKDLSSWDQNEGPRKQKSPRKGPRKNPVTKPKNGHWDLWDLFFFNLYIRKKERNTYMFYMGKKMPKKKVPKVPVLNFN